MSLKLTPQLIEQIHQQLINADIRAQNEGVAAQYLAGVIGTLLTELDMSSASRNELLNDLRNFSQLVAEDIIANRKANPVPPPVEESRVEVAIPTWKPKQP